MLGGSSMIMWILLGINSFLLLVVCVLLSIVLRCSRLVEKLETKIEEECGIIVRNYIPLHDQMKQIVEDMLEMDNKFVQCHKESIQAHEAQNVILSTLNNNTDQMIQVIHNLQGTLVSLDRLIRESNEEPKQKPAGVKFKFGQANYRGGRHA